MGRVENGVSLTIPDWFKEGKLNCANCESVLSAEKRAREWLPTGVVDGEINISCTPTVIEPGVELKTEATHSQKSSSSLSFSQIEECPPTKQILKMLTTYD